MPRQFQPSRVIRFAAPLLLATCLLIPLSTAAQAQQDTPTPTHVMPRSGPFSPEQIEIPNARAIEAWIRSGHSQSGAPAFSHWNDQGAIPPVCSTCHSGQGFRSTLGLDGSAPGLPEAPVPTGGVVDCDTCHNSNLAQVTEITLPSGVAHPVTTADAACVTCHSGRAAGASVDRATGDAEADTVVGGMGFVNPHYAVAAAMQLGGYGGMGFQFPGKDYSGRFLHAQPVETCVSCHDPHSLSVAGDACQTCHRTGDPRAIRISRQSFDGSGNTTKGIFRDIQGNSDVLMATIRDYAAQVAGTPVVYDGAHHPYFFADANGDGVADQADGARVAYNSWTPRMLRAAYNWKFVGSDGGAHVHNPHYALELLHDSIEDLYAATGGDFAALGLAR